MVCIYYNGIEIPSFQISHIWFYTVPVRFFTDAYTWYAYTIMALRSPHSRFRIYSSCMVLYRFLNMVCIYYNGIEIPSFQILHLWFYTVPVWFFTEAFTCLYGTLHVHFYITGFYTAQHCGAKKYLTFLMSIWASITMNIVKWNIHLQMMTS